MVRPGSLLSLLLVPFLCVWPLAASSSFAGTDCSELLQLTGESVSATFFEDLREFEAGYPTVWFLPDHPAHIESRAILDEAGQPSPAHRVLKFGTYEFGDRGMGFAHAELDSKVDAHFFIERMEALSEETRSTQKAWKTLPYSDWFALEGEVRPGDLMILMQGDPPEAPVLKAYVIIHTHKQPLGRGDLKNWGTRGNTAWTVTAYHLETAATEAKRRGLREIGDYFDRGYALFHGLLDEAMGDFSRILRTEAMRSRP